MEWFAGQAIRTAVLQSHPDMFGTNSRVGFVEAVLTRRNRDIPAVTSARYTIIPSAAGGGIVRLICTVEDTGGNFPYSGGLSVTGLSADRQDLPCTFYQYYSGDVAFGPRDSGRLHQLTFNLADGANNLFRQTMNVDLS